MNVLAIDFDQIIKFIIPVVVIIYYIVSAARGGKSEEEQVDPEEADRRRRIQEEIRRKILERQSGGAPQPPPEAREETPDFIFEEEFEEPETLREPVRPVRRTTAPAPTVVEAPVRDYASEVAEQQRKMAEQQSRIEEQLRQARERMRGVARAATPSARPGATLGFDESQFAGDRLSASVKRDLQSAGSLRRAIILKEVLDKPVGLR
ncbi:MAG: hypothetical protein F6K21_25740 [Symploca sp. SIO2D2]|nr:hypothetical protein [Symploca sp. SIO2D2]